MLAPAPAPPQPSVLVFDDNLDLFDQKRRTTAAFELPASQTTVLFTIEPGVIGTGMTSPRAVVQLLVTHFTARGDRASLAEALDLATQLGVLPE